MKIFISGATGVLGRRVVPELVALGHNVSGLSRSNENEMHLADQGATPAHGDLFDPDSLLSLAEGAEVILHLASSIPTKTRSRRADWRSNDRIRTEGTQNLLRAARANGCRLFLVPSLTAVYGDRGGGWVDETATPANGLPVVLHSAVAMEHAVRHAEQEGVPGTILRMGMFYAADAAQTQSMLRALAKGFFPYFGEGENYWTLLHVADAAQAVVRCVENVEAAASRTFNICDDEPVRVRRLLRSLAQHLNARSPLSVPRWLARPLLGGHVAGFLLASVRCRNLAAKSTLGWEPAFPTYHKGYEQVIGRWRGGARTAAGPGSGHRPQE